LAEIDHERVKVVFETNLFSTLQRTKKVLPKMIAKGDGRILFIGSMAGHIPTPFYELFATTKFALESVALSTNRIEAI
jgi:short-subunit dehydrogenase